MPFQHSSFGASFVLHPHKTMNRPTLSLVKSSSLPGRVGLCATDTTAVAMIVNEAQERLLNDPMAPDEGWWGGWATMRFNVQVTNRYAYVITPHDIARLIVLDVCQTPVRIQNGFYEFLEFGIGLQPKASCTSSQQCACSVQAQAYERANVVTLYDQTINPAIIRLYPGDPSDYGRRVLLQGKDQNGKPVLGVDPSTRQSILGEFINLELPFSDSLNSYSQITGIQKGAMLGQLTINQVDPVTYYESNLSVMEPNEYTASYRKYLINGLPVNCCNTSSGIVQITAQAKLDFVPVLSDSDYLLIQNIPALIEEAQSIKYSSMDSSNAPNLEAKHHAKALQLLFGQIDHYMGKTNTAIRVPIFGSDRPKLQPI